jgi:hypothetical protein
VAELQTPQPQDVAGERSLYDEHGKQIIFKQEKSHAYLDYRNSTRTMVARIFRTKCLRWHSTFRQCYPYIARYRCNPCSIKFTRDYINQYFGVGKVVTLPTPKIRKDTHHVIYNYYRINNTICNRLLKIKLLYLRHTLQKHFMNMLNKVMTRGDLLAYPTKRGLNAF